MQPSAAQAMAASLHLPPAPGASQAPATVHQEADTAVAGQAALKQEYDADECILCIYEAATVGAGTELSSRAEMWRAWIKTSMTTTLQAS